MLQMEYESPKITVIGDDQVSPQSCTVLAVVLAVIIAAAGAYVAVGYAYVAGAALAVYAAAWYGTISMTCVDA